MHQPTRLLAASLLVFPLFASLSPGQSQQFRRGDADTDGTVNLTDPIFTLQWLFVGSRPPTCMDAADCNDSGDLDISDAITLLGCLFLGAGPLPPPTPGACGVDPTEDDLNCIYYEPCAAEPDTTKVLMLLIEYEEDIGGLVNFVYELHEQGIPALVQVSGMYVSQHCEEFRTLAKYGVEVAASLGWLMWGVPYEQQYELASSSKASIEACLGKPIRVLTTALAATDETTWRIADELDVPFVFVRGTTGTRATVFKAEEYDVTIVNQSNMVSERWAFGSLCDYSVWARGGTPENLKAEIADALRHDRITMLCHTRLGGVKEAWYSVFEDLFDNPGVTFVDLDGLTETVDVTLPASEIPRNWANPYGPAPEPLVPYDEEPNVDNPCQIDELPPIPGSGDVGSRIVFYHNGVGPMCLDFLAFLETIDYPIEEHLVGEPDFWEDMERLKKEFGSSEGVSQTFGYFPIIFIKTRAFSGFNSQLAETIRALIAP